MTSANETPLVIGVDGRSSEVSARHIIVEERDDETIFRLGDAQDTQDFRQIVGLEQPPLREQVQEFESGHIEPSGFEVAQAKIYADTTAEAITNTVKAAGAGTRIIVGIGFPGLKTADGRGIAVANRMARAPEFLDELERALVKRGLELAAPISRLGSSADYSGVGEEYAPAGLFRGVRHGYYAGCGNGIAEALKLRGKLVPFDNTKAWMRKAWQMRSSLGESYEQIASAGALIQRYANAVHLTPEEVEACGRFPELAARHGDTIAMHLLTKAAAALAELFEKRVRTVFKRRRGLLLERLIIGGRLGRLYGNPRYRDLFRDKLDAQITQRLGDCGIPEIVTYYTFPGGRLRDGVLVASRLRAAPALGAAIDAHRKYANLPDVFHASPPPVSDQEEPAESE